MKKNLFTLLVLSSFATPYAMANDANNLTAMNKKYTEDITEQVIEYLKTNDSFYNHSHWLGAYKWGPGTVDGLTLGMGIERGQVFENNAEFIDGKSYIHVAKNITVNDHATIYNNGHIEDITINSGGEVRIFSNDINDHETEGLPNDPEAPRYYGTGKNITMNGTADNRSKLLIFWGGSANNVTLNGYSAFTVQTLQTTKRPSFIRNVELNDNTVGEIYANGYIEDAILNDKSRLAIYSGGYAKGYLDLNDQSRLYLYTDGQHLNSETPLHVAGVYAENVNVASKDAQLIIRLAERSKEHLASVGNLINNGVVELDHVNDQASYIQLDIENLSGGGEFIMNVAGNGGDRLNITNSTSGKHSLWVQDRGEESDLYDSHELIHAMGGDNENFALKHGEVDLGAYLYYLDHKQDSTGKYIWFLTDEKPTDPEPEGENPPGIVPPEKPPAPEKPPTPQTTPSVDAALSMASVAQFIFEGELQNLRLRRGALADNASTDDVNVWGRYLNNKMRVTGAENAAYRLKQSGMELGVDKLYGFEQGRLSVGVSAATSSNRVTHSRGGDSNINSYSASLYATYLANNGVYVDGVIKTAQFNNRLNARMTGGSHAQAKYNQFGIGGSLESGYRYQFGHEDVKHFIEPYLRASYLTTSAKNFTMNNAMNVALERQQSLRGEVGVNLGTAFKLTDHTTLRPYIKAAFEHEFIKYNDIHINNKHSFNNELAGSRGKYGAGLDLTIGNNAAIYTELNYINGSKVESPIVANLGFRFNF